MTRNQETRNLETLEELTGMKYSKGMSVASFLGSLDMGVIRGKRKAVLKRLEEALGVRIEETKKK